jgi:hypothetical protein
LGHQAALREVGSSPTGRARELIKSKNSSMDKVTRYEWHGSWLLLTLLGFFVITIPIAVVYFITRLLKIETQVSDAQKLSEFLRSKK